MPGPWSREENELIVADYLAMLEAELAGRRYVKAEHSRRLRALLRDRSKQSVEFKHCNISAVLIDLGFPYIAGYQPRWNAQWRVLPEIVFAQLTARPKLLALAATDATLSVEAPTPRDPLAALEDPPEARPQGKSLRDAAFTPTLAVNYLEREAAFHTLGAAGESFVLAFERARLEAANLPALAERVEQVSETRGAVAGFDVLSYETDGRERLIEVKTTKYGKETPFFVTAHELATSTRSAPAYHLYRVFDFRRAPRLFMLRGAIDQSCELAPQSYVARPGTTRTPSGGDHSNA